jgi:type I restriction enzyme M protein
MADTIKEQEDTHEVVGIIAQNAEIDRIVARKDVLCKEIAAIIADKEVGAAK